MRTKPHIWLSGGLWRCAYRFNGHCGPSVSGDNPLNAHANFIRWVWAIQQ